MIKLDTLTLKYKQRCGNVSIYHDLFTNLKFSTKTKNETNENFISNYKYFTKEKYINGKMINFVIVKFISNFIIEDDINLKINSRKNNFNFWVNFFYLTLEKYLLSIDKIFSLNLVNKNIKLFTCEENKKNKENLKER